MSSYSNFALVYDSLMSDVDYSARTEYILKLFQKHGKKPTLLLDLACGTGNFSNLLALEGIEVIGIDMSEEMLSSAREKSVRMGTDVLFLCQKAEELDLYGTVDGAICCMDSVNHITDRKKLEAAFQKVSLFLEKDSLFIFDVNTPYKHKEILGNNTFVIEQEDVYCVWQNEFCEKTLTTDIMLDFFVEEENGSYTRFSEDFSEKAYTKEQLYNLLENCGFELVAVYDDMSEQPSKTNSEREFYVARKIR